MSITIKWLLNSQKIQNLRCVAGFEYISNELTSVNVIDNYDIFGWIGKKELALTTGFLFQDNPEKQVQIIRDLKLAGSSGLGIKINRYFDIIPQCMIDVANEIGLPLIEVPYYYSFSEISNIVFSSIHQEEINEQSFASNLLFQLSELYYNNNSFHDILSLLSERINNICLISRMNKVIDYHIPDSKMKNFLMYKEDEDLTIKIEELAIENTNEKKAYYSINEIVYSFFTLPLPNGTTNLLLDCNTSSENISAAKNCLHILSLQLESDKTIIRKFVNNNFYSLFYDTLLDNRKRKPNSMKTIFDYYGFDYTKKRVCITIDLCKKYHDNIKATFEKTKEILDNLNVTYFNAFHLNYINIFIYYKLETSVAIAVSNSIKIANELYENINNFFNCTSSNSACTIGIGRCHKQITTVSLALQDSMDAVKMNKLTQKTSGVITYFSQITLHVLASLNQDELQKIYQDSIKQLADFDKENNTELIDTIRAYFSCKFNASETAKKLFLHRNTLSHRLDKIKNLLCVDLTVPEENFSLYLSLCAMDLLEET